MLINLCGTEIPVQLLFCSCAYQKYTLVQFHLEILSWLWYHRYGFNLFDYQHRSEIYSVSYKIQPVTVQNSRVSFHTRRYYCIESCQKNNVPAALILRSNYKTRLGSQFKAIVKNSARIFRMFYSHFIYNRLWWECEHRHKDIRKRWDQFFPSRHYAHTAVMLLFESFRSDYGY